MAAPHPKADRQSPRFPMEKGRPVAGPPFPFSTRRWKKLLALRELEAAAGLRLAVLLALDRAAVAGQEAGRLDDAAQRGLEAGQCLGDAVQNGARLARQEIGRASCRERVCQYV